VLVTLTRKELRALLFQGASAVARASSGYASLWGGSIGRHLCRRCAHLTGAVHTAREKMRIHFNSIGLLTRIFAVGVPLLGERDHKSFVNEYG